MLKFKIGKSQSNTFDEYLGWFLLTVAGGIVIGTLSGESRKEQDLFGVAQGDKL